MKTRIVNIRKEGHDIYIGRGSKWGNPYPINEMLGRTREVVIALYAKYLATSFYGKNLLKDLDELEGKRLGCYCKPLACHGDILVELIEKRRMKNERKNSKKT